MSLPASPRKRRKEVRPAELVSAALAEFVDRGFAATRLDDVARRAGVSKGTLYLYFDSKEALFKAVIQEGVVPVLDAADAMVAGHAGGAADLLEALVFHWWERIGETEWSGVTKLMMAEAKNFPDVANFYYEHVIRRARALFALVIERGMASGEFRAVPVDTTIDVLVAPMLMFAIWRHSLADCQASPADPRQCLAFHLNLLRQGLRASRL